MFDLVQHADAFSYFVSDDCAALHLIIKWPNRSMIPSKGSSRAGRKNDVQEHHSASSTSQRTSAREALEAVVVI